MGMLGFTLAESYRDIILLYPWRHHCYKYLTIRTGTGLEISFSSIISEISFKNNNGGIYIFSQIYKDLNGDPSLKKTLI